MFVRLKTSCSAKPRTFGAKCLRWHAMGFRLLALVATAALVVQTGVAVPKAGILQSAASSLPSEEDPVPTRMAEEIKHTVPAQCAASRLKPLRDSSERFTARDRRLTRIARQCGRPLRADLEARNGIGCPLRC
jgi:hypothetical protein